MPQILLIQFRTNERSAEMECASIQREVGDGLDIVRVSALDAHTDWQYPEIIMEGKSGVILGGSGDLDFDGGRPEDDPVRHLSYELVGKLRPLFTYIFEHDIPTLGICYGHQILGAFAGAQVHSDPDQRKTRSHEVRLLAEAHNQFLFAEVPDTFQAHYGHKDVLDRVPPGAVLLMEGGVACRVSALRYKNNIYTTQFHPELTLDDMVLRIKQSPGYLPEGTTVESLFSDDTRSNRILKNFGTLVIEHATHKTGT